MTNKPPSTPNITNLPTQHRYITAHDSNGKSIFSTTLPEAATYETITPDIDAYIAWSNLFPPNLTESTDLDFHVASVTSPNTSPPTTTTTNTTNTTNTDPTPTIAKNDGTHQTPPICLPNGVVLRAANFAPGYTSMMHRTRSLDLGIVVAGQVELILDSGEKRLMKVGDIAVQRGTMHAWRTVGGAGEWARMVWVLQPAERLVVGGREVGDHFD